jgi:hypothetical protein
VWTGALWFDVTNLDFGIYRIMNQKREVAKVSDRLVVPADSVGIADTIRIGT